jgi:hypothetical protein
VLSAAWLVAGSSDGDTSFSVPILVLAAAVGLGWLAMAAVIAAVRSIPHVEPAAATQDLPGATPAMANLLCSDFELGTEAVPATLLDLAARRVVALEEVQPGHTICRVRGTGSRSGALDDYEQRVLAAVTAKAVEGVVPAEALTTGTEEASRGWRRAFAKEVIGVAQRAGLTYDRWPKAYVALVGLGVLVVGGLLYLASAVGDGTDRDIGANAAVAGGVAVASLIGIAAVSARLGASLAQLPTPEGRVAAGRCLGLQAHLRENEHLDDVAPAAVVMWGRHLAYAAALGSAAHCVAALPMGAEDDHHAWSRFGGRWRKVRVGYPRARPPAWGKSPGFAAFLGVAWGGAAVAAIYGLATLAREVGDSTTGGLTREQSDWIGRAALVVCIPCALLLAWALYVLSQAVPDLWQRREVRGEIVRARARQQVFGGSRDHPVYWYYLALDDGSTTRVTAWRVRRELYDSCSQGDVVTAGVTPNLGHVRWVLKAEEGPPDDVRRS